MHMKINGRKKKRKKVEDMESDEIKNRGEMVIM